MSMLLVAPSPLRGRNRKSVSHDVGRVAGNGVNSVVKLVEPALALGRTNEIVSCV